ncbi:aldehyde dehydrogenase family protein [Microbacterium tenebrionis]|uniref:aldehyde dehydrogenase family protein n=1 Tax=Microbacterium tenebrionis TaxID=2830665 RepID=UPI00158B093A|nr:aldehyde dehydrogenase family protein [Microbacterium ihumii]
MTDYDYAVTNPATGETVATYETATDAQIEDAVARAHAAASAWGATPPADRAAVIRRIAELHRERKDDLGAVIVKEMGKPIAAAVGEVEFAADIIEFYADNIERITGDQPLDILGDGTAVIRRAPLGVLLGIMPWNFPAYQVARFAAPNLAIGNTIILKHAPQCPESAAMIEGIYADAGLPDGAYVNVYATNEQAATIIADPRVHGVSVTGSERAGAAVAEVAGRNLKKVALELGGSDPFIVLSTDDLDAVVQNAVDARLDNNGQSCNGAKRFIIADDLYDAFVEKFVAALAAVDAADPTQEDTILGPLSSLAAAERLQDQVDRAVAQGATLLTGGTREGAFFAPTVLADVTADMDAYQEELFGPAAVVYRAADEADAVAIANGTPFGLGSYVFTTDAEQAERVADGIEAGMVYVNLVLADSPELPFGGVKRSGTSRELGLLAADEFVNKKLIRKA